MRRGLLGAAGPGRNCAPSAPRAGASVRPLNFTVRRHFEDYYMPFTKLLGPTLALLLALPCNAATAPLQTKQDAHALAESVMKLVAADKIDDAFGLLKPYWPMASSELDMLVMKTVTLRNTVGDRFGPTLGYAFVREDAVGDFLVRYTYVEKRSKHPLRWTFTFYRGASQWTVDAASWDDKVSELFSP